MSSCSPGLARRSLDTGPGRTEVLHLFYARGPLNPWKGVSPIEASQTTRALLDNMERRLAEELGAAVGSVITVPNIESTSQLQADLRGLHGEVTLVETTAGRLRQLEPLERQHRTSSPSA